MWKITQKEKSFQNNIQLTTKQHTTYHKITYNLPQNNIQLTTILNCTVGGYSYPNIKNHCTCFKKCYPNDICACV